MPVRIDSIGQVLLRKELKDYIKSLEPGDVVKGRVVDNKNGEVTIKATNGQVIKAALSTDISLQEGQFIEMQVDDVLDDRVYASLQAVEKKTENPEQLLRALVKSLGLPATPANLAIAKTLIKNNLPITTEAVNELVNQLKSSDALTKASAESIIGLLASGTDLRNTNVDVLRKLATNFEADLKQYMEDLDSTSDDDSTYSFPEYDEDGKEVNNSDKSMRTDVKVNTNQSLNTPINQKGVITDETASEQDVIGMNQKSTSVVSDDVTTVNTGIPTELESDIKTGLGVKAGMEAKTGSDGKVGNETKTGQSIQTDAAEDAETSNDIQKFSTLKTGKESAPQSAYSTVDTRSLPKSFSEINTAYQNNGAFSRDSINAGLGNLTLVGKTGNDPKQITLKKESISPEAIKMMLEKVGIETTPEIDAFIEKTANLLSKLDSVSLDKLAWLASKGLEATPANLEALDNHINNTNNISSLLSKLDNQLSSYSDPNLKSLREVVANLSLNPQDLLEPDRVKETLRDLVKISESIDLYLSRSGINDDGIRNTLSNVKDNIDFMRQINQFNNFVQIPLKLNEKNATADMYVYKDKSRSKLIDPENATILIALDLPRSGRIESMIKLTGKTVNATFRLEQDEVGFAIKRGEKTLADRLEARGYQLMPIKTIQLNEVFNLMKLEELIGGASIDRLHFDLRV